MFFGGISEWSGFENLSIIGRFGSHNFILDYRGFTFPSNINKNTKEKGIAKNTGDITHTVSKRPSKAIPETFSPYFVLLR